MKHLVAITITVLVAFPMSAAHPRCYVPTPTEALAGAKAVFVGKVISITDPTLPAEGISYRVFNLVRPVKVRFAVEHVYRGRKIREIEVGTQTGGLDWGYEFKVGERYLVYAQQAGDSKRGLVVKGCSRSRPVNEAAEDLKLLNGSLNLKTSKSPPLTLPISCQPFQWARLTIRWTRAESAGFLSTT
jgi:hypothetical protein